MRLNFDPNQVAEATRIMTDEQYYALKAIAGKPDADGKSFDALAVEFLSNAKEQYQARADQERAHMKDLIREVMQEAE